MTPGADHAGESPISTESLSERLLRLSLDFGELGYETLSGCSISMFHEKLRNWEQLGLKLIEYLEATDTHSRSTPTV